MANLLRPKLAVKTSVIKIITITCVSSLLLANFVLNVWYANKQITKELDLHSPQNDGFVVDQSFKIIPKKNPLLNQKLEPSDYDTLTSLTSDNKCRNEYKRVTSNQISGLTKEDLRRSRAWVGNEQRLANVVKKLQNHNDPMKATPITAVVCGGSISMGHGLYQSSIWRYSHRLEEWLNEFYPIAPNNANRQHKVFNRGSHGADICAMAKRMDLIFDKIYKDSNEYSYPDLIILEFAVNDYQGQDHKIHVDHKTDMFFDGFQEKVMCTEAVIHNILRRYPKTAVLFLETQTAILNRKTAQVLHMGVAQHYQIPIISYAEVVMPGYYQLIKDLAPFQYNRANNNSVLPYPHGCAHCQLKSIDKTFRYGGCKSLCTLLSRSNLIKVDQCDLHNIPAGREPCYTAFWAPDAVHPSRVGHNIISNLIAHTLASLQNDMCNGHAPTDHVLPPPGIHFLTSAEDLSVMTDFVFVKDTMSVFGEQDELTATNFSTGFKLYGDAFAERRGWISDSVAGGDYIEFETQMEKGCYVLYLAMLKSYEGMGVATVRVHDLITGKRFEMEIDGIWKPHISVPSDIPLLPKTKDLTCTGNCVVTVLTHPQHASRRGNKVKITTLSARLCRGSDFPEGQEITFG